MTLLVSQLSEACAIKTAETNDAKYIEYFIAVNCYAPPFRIRLSNKLLFIHALLRQHRAANEKYLPFQVGK